MDLENEKIGSAFSAPDAYFKDKEARLLQRLGIQREESTVQTIEPIQDTSRENVPVVNIDTTGVQKRARKQDPITSKSDGINKDVDALGNVVIPPLTFTTNENPEWVNFGAIAEEVSGGEQDIKVVSYGDLLDNAPEPIVESAAPLVESAEPEIETVIEPMVETVVEPVVSNPSEENKVIIHEVPESVGLDELESYIVSKNTSSPTPLDTPIEIHSADTPEEITQSPLLEDEQPVITAVREEKPIVVETEEKPISLEAPATAFAPIAGRQRESATPGWLGVAAALAAIVAAYFIWTAIQPPKLDTEQVVLQQDEATIPEAPLDEQTSTDTIPDGLQLVEPLITEEMPKYKEPNVYTIIDSEDMPERTRQALKDLEDNGLATFDMEDELFEELDLESL
jgi:hypothetical protein